MDPSKQETNQKKSFETMARKETQEFQFVVYNTMTQQKEVFKPKTPGKVHMYVCGVAAYDFSHLGHARTAVSFDVLYRYLKHLGYEVTYVRNFTDVDDKIIRRANEIGEDPISLSDRYCKEYNIDMSDLQCLSPTHEPRVSDHMEQIKDMITQRCVYISSDGDRVCQPLVIVDKRVSRIKEHHMKDLLVRVMLPILSKENRLG